MRRTQIITNEYFNLVFKKQQDRYTDGKRKTRILGMLFRTFSEIDLEQLNLIVVQLKNRQKISTIDLESIYSTYEGHTIFSIFWDQITVYE